MSRAANDAHSQLIWLLGYSLEQSFLEQLVVWSMKYQEIVHQYFTKPQHRGIRTSPKIIKVLNGEKKIPFKIINQINKQLID